MPVAEKIKSSLRAADPRFEVIQSCPLVMMANKVLPGTKPAPHNTPEDSTSLTVIKELQKFG